MAEVRAGATLLHASDPEREEAECRLKASALFEVLGADVADTPAPSEAGRRQTPSPRHGCCSSTTVTRLCTRSGDYLRQAGATLTTRRVPADGLGYQGELAGFDHVVLSPGPGRPSDFGAHATLQRCEQAGVPVFGVCLGLQAMIEYFGGQLGVLDRPAHGEPVAVDATPAGLFEGFPETFEAARYHSLYARTVPPDLEVTARTPEGLVMAVEHASLPMRAVQFHPESILTDRRLGLRMLANVLRLRPVHGARRVSDSVPARTPFEHAPGTR